ncbi:MAG: hypothetical protein AB1599_01330 [Planctomycetota bacterium]
MIKEQKLNVSRWIIFVLVALAIIIPVLLKEKISLPETSSNVVRNIYDHIDSLPEGAPIIISIDFDPSSDEELRPMATAILEHAFRKNLRVIGMTIWGIPASGTLIDIFTKGAEKHHKQSGVDYAILPFKTGGGVAVLLPMSEDIFSVFPKDYKDNSTKEMAVFKGIKSLKDMKYAMCISAGNAVDQWIIFGKEKGKMPLGAGCTGVMATDYYHFLQSGQMLGLMGGLSAAAQYETLIKQKGTATDSMKPQTIVHAVIIILIIIGNIIYLTKRKKA